MDFQNFMNPNATPDKIAEAYQAGDINTVNNLIAAANMTAQQANDIWGSGIASLAAEKGVNFATAPVAQPYSATVPTVAPTVTKVEDLYQQLLGRAPDAAGLKYWQDTYGTGPVTADELAAFKYAAAPEISAKNAANTWFTANPDATIQQVVDTVKNSGGLTPQMASVLAQHYGTDTNTIQAGYEKQLADEAAAKQMAEYTNLVTQAYGDIGRTGVGTAASNIDKPGLDYWVDQLKSGAIKKEDLPKTFQAAVLEYKKQHPDDPYTKYVNEYQLGKQTDTLKNTISDVLSDQSITLAEANNIRDYYNNYLFKPEDIARVTGRPVEVINQILGARNTILGNAYTANAADPFSLLDYQKTNKLTDDDIVSMSGGKISKDAWSNTKQALTGYQDALTGKGDYSQGLTDFANFASSDPALAQKYAPQIAAINNAKSIIAQHALNKDFGGQYKDYAMQMFLGLDDKTKRQAPTQLEITPAKTAERTSIDEVTNQPYKDTVVLEPAALKPGQGVQPVYESTETGYELTGYRKLLDSPAFDNTFSDKQRFGVYANYDANGKLTGYSSDAHVHINDPQWYGGRWDAAGNAKPTTGANRPGGNFAISALGDMVGGIKDIVGQDLWTIAKVIPNPATPYIYAADAVQAASQGNLKGAALNAVGSYAAYQGNVASDAVDPSSVNYTNAADIASDLASTGTTVTATALSNQAIARTALASVAAYDAATSDNPNYTPLLNVAASVSGLNNNPTVATAFNTLGVINAAANNDLTGVFNAAGNLTGSKDLKLVAAANNFRQAYESGNSSAQIAALAGLTEAAQNNSRTSGAVDTVKNFIDRSVATAKGETVSVIDKLTNAGLTETNPTTDLSSYVGKTGTSGTPSGATETTATPTTTTTPDTEFGNLQGAIDAATLRNTVNVAADKATSVDDALKVARAENPNATQFTYDGKTYGISASNQAVLESAGIKTTPTVVTPTTTKSSTPTAVSSYVSNKLTQNISDPNFNPADLTAKEMTAFVNNYANANDTQKAQLLKGADAATYKVIDSLIGERNTLLTKYPSGIVPMGAGASTTDSLSAWDKGLLLTAKDVTSAALNTAAADVAGVATRGAQFLGNLMGQDTDSLSKVQTLLTDDKDKSMSKLVGNEKVVAGGMASGIESALAWTLGGPAASVATIGGVVANNSWVEGAKAGLSTTDNAMRTAAMTTVEVAGEMLGIPGMKNIMKGVPVTGTVSEIVDGVKKAAGGMLNEQASELLTTVAQFSLDKFASFGLTKNATFEDFQTALKDTVIATTAAVGSSSGISTAVSAAKGQTPTISDADRAPVVPGTIFTEGSKLGAVAGATPTNIGLNQITGEQIDFNKLDSKDQTTILDNLRSQFANITLTTALTFGGVTGAEAAANIQPAVTQSIQTMTEGGGNVNNAINLTVSSAVQTSIENKVDPATAINDTVNAAITAASQSSTKADVNTAISSAVQSAVQSAVKSGVNVNTATQAAIKAAVNVASSVNVSTETATSIATKAATSATSTATATPTTDTATSTATTTPTTVPPTTTTTPITTVTPETPVTPVTTSKPATPTSTKTTAAQSTGLNFGQVQQALAQAGIPQLANVFYYGKEFGSQKQKLDKRGKLVEEEYDPLSVTKAGAVGELEEQVAEEAKTKENDVNTALDHILGASSNATSLDDLLNIVKGA